MSSRSFGQQRVRIGREIDADHVGLLVDDMIDEPGILVAEAVAQWPEFDLEAAEWRIPAERMKMKAAHIVPLSSQAIEVIEQLRALNGYSKWVFPNQANPAKCMSENTMLYALYRMGYHSRATGHGFRTTASTILNETGFRADAIERQLAHVEPNKVRGAYKQGRISARAPPDDAGLGGHARRHGRKR